MLPALPAWAMWAALLALHFALRLPALFSFGPTYDEPIYLGTSLHFASHGDGTIAPYLYHPPLAYHLSSLPLAFLDVPLPAWDPSGPNVQVGLGVLYDATRGGSPVAPETVLLLARLPILAASVLGLVFLRFLGRRLGGDAAGWLAAAAWAFFPEAASQSVQATTDLVAGVAALGLAAAAVRYLDGASSPASARRKDALILGAALGCALLSKHTLVVHAGAVAGVVAVARFRRGRSPGGLGRVALAAAAAFLVVWAGYGFELAPLARVSGDVPIPAPSYLRSLGDALFDKARARSGTLWTAYMNGEWSEGGFLSYFLVATLVKTPTAMLVCLAAGLFTARRGLRDARTAAAAWTCLALFALPVAAAVVSRLNLGFRHLLPALPLLFPLAAAGLASVRVPFAAWAATFLLLAAEWAPCLRDPLAFANRPSGGPSRLHERLADSNLEMGQDLWRVIAWAEAAGAAEVTPLVHVPEAVLRREAARSPRVRAESPSGGELVVLIPQTPQDAPLAGAKLLAVGESVLVLPRYRALLAVEPAASLGRTRIYRRP
ncbi:MAG: hypothetical protein HMLKMBBP_00693 [Planctomycetes bacterium]|nr:hypothetical protein [Planctomycetota bacterium]